MREYKRYHSVFVPTRHEIEISKKIVKKFETLKNTNMAPFQAKIGCKTHRNRENKICHSVPFRSVPTLGNRKFQKNSKKIEKIKIYHYGIISRQNRLENAKKQKK